MLHNKELDGTLYKPEAPVIFTKADSALLKDGKPFFIPDWSEREVDELIAYISTYFTLKTGDLLYTGTPVGVGPVKIDDHLEGWIEDRKVLDFNCK